MGFSGTTPKVSSFSSPTYEFECPALPLWFFKQARGDGNNLGVAQCLVYTLGGSQICCQGSEPWFNGLGTELKLLGACRLE